MPLVTRNPGDTIRSADVDQFGYLLTGSMADQPVTVGQIVNVQGRPINALRLASPTITGCPIANGAASEYNYQIVAQNADGDAIPGATYVITTGPAAFDSTHTATPTWPPAPGATNYLVLKAAGHLPAQTSFQQIGTVTAVSGFTGSYSFIDTGQTASAYTARNVSPGGAVSANMMGAQARFIGRWPTTGAPPTIGGGLLYSVGDWGYDVNGFEWFCTVAGATGTWSTQAGGTLPGGYAQVTAQQGPLSVITDVTGLSVTVTTFAGRRYRISGNCIAQNSSSGGANALYIADGSNSQLQEDIQPVNGLFLCTLKPELIHVPGAGTRTYKLRILGYSGTVIANAANTSATPSFILVEDIGGY